MKYIKNGRLVLPDRIVDGAILAYGEKIVGTVSECGDGEVIDAKGAYVCPGLVDIHIHGYKNRDASDGDADGIREMAYGIAKNGVTSFLPTTMTVSKKELVAAFNVIRSQKEDSK